MVVGSGNLTSKGMHLGISGNYELNTVVDADEGAKSLVKEVFLQARPFENSLIDSMEAFLATQSADNLDSSWWPKEMIGEQDRRLFCNDFPQVDFGEVGEVEGSVWSEIKLHIENNNSVNAREELLNSPSFIWLGGVLSEQEREINFGLLSKLLHDVLADDPAPYRRDVKIYLANLLSFVTKVPDSGVVVRRPRHSQLVSLKRA